MKCHLASLFALWTIAGSLSLPAARADILVSNLDQPIRSATPIAEMQYWGAQSFTTSDFALTIASVTVLAGNAADAPAVVAYLRMSTGIDGEIDNTAGGLVGTFTAPDMSGATSARTFTPDGDLTLDLSTKYWFILGSTNEGTYDWSYADTPITSGPGTLNNYADSSDGGATWDHSIDSYPYFVEINGGAAIPEPAGMLPLAWLVPVPSAAESAAFDVQPFPD